MRVKIYASGYCSFDHIDDEGFMTLTEGASVKDVLKKLGIPMVLRRLPLVAVNYEQVKVGTELKDGDVVSLLGPLSGG